MPLPPTSPSDGLSDLEIISRRWPAVAQAMANAVDLAAHWDDTLPQGTLVVEGIHLSSGYDPDAEARLQASLIPADAAEAWVYGVGGGALPRQLLERRSLHRLHVVIMNTGVFRAALARFNHREWLGDPRVELELADASSQLHAPFSAVPSCLQLAGDEAAALRDRVQLELDSELINRRFEQEQTAPDALTDNLAALSGDGDVAELFDSQAGGTISVVAAGPTLDFQYGFLANPQPIIAVDRCLALLVERGIVPRWVVSIDPHPNVAGYLDIPEEIARRITLIYAPTIPSAAVTAWSGPRLAFYAEAPLFDEVREQCPKGNLFRSGSVIHPAVDLAVRMGARQVLLFGADFAFPYGKHHADGSLLPRPPEEDERVWVHDWSGERVPTLNNLRGYLRDLEDYIKAHPETRFYSIGEAGARTEGSTLLPL